MHVHVQQHWNSKGSVMTLDYTLCLDCGQSWHPERPIVKDATGAIKPTYRVIRVMK
jgi:hypothetical protein